ncbi:MAG TPA: PAS domain-containing protein, partial [Candidatus Brocadiia bacterium]|nr:PAS domain-containing protein [Candidatus Brocadiia bacterium]
MDYRAVLDNLRDGVYIVDPDRRILFWNRGAEAIA